MKNFIIRTMDVEDVALAMEWARLEGWNPGLHDADLFHRTDPDGFFIGELDGEPIGCISAIKYSSGFGFIGLYIVKPDYRGKGYGFGIWQTGIGYLNGCNIGLDGVLTQQRDYVKSGFKLHYSNVRYEGMSEGWEPRYSENLECVPFDDLLKYDSRIFGLARPRFLERWIQQPGSYGCCSIEHGKLAGYGVMRKCFSGYKIGPLFADTPEVARDILDSLLSNIGGETYCLDVPEVNTAGVDMAEEYGLKPVFGAARMYTGDTYRIPVERVFGVTTLELG